MGGISKSARGRRYRAASRLGGGEPLEARRVLAVLVPVGGDSSNLANSPNPAQQAFDGRLETAWIAPAAGPAFLTVDLGAIHSITGIEQHFVNRDVWRYRIDGSNENAGWTTIIDQTANLASGTSYVHNVSVAYRFVRMEVTASVNRSVPSSAEFRVMGSLLEQPRDLVPAPRPVSTGDVLVVAQACNLWSAPFHWEALKPTAYPERLSVLGAYDEAYDVATDWQIKMAVENGVGGFFSTWFRQKGNEGKPVMPMYDAFLQSLANSAQYRDSVRFGFQWENSNPVAAGAAGIRDFVDNVVPYWIREYFTRPNYWTIDGKPVVSFYSAPSFITHMGGVSAARTALDSFRSAMTAAGFPGVIVLTADNARTTASFVDEQTVGFDWIYNYHIPTFMNTMPANRTPASMINAHSVTWSNYEQYSRVPYLMTASVGWDARPWGGKQPIWEIPPADFKTLLSMAKTRMQAKPAASLARRVLFIDNWNEYSEGHYVMPSRGYGFGYLNAIRDVFATTADRPPNPSPDLAAVPQLLDFGLVTSVTVQAAGGQAAISLNQGTLQLTATTAPAHVAATVTWQVVAADGVSSTDVARIDSTTGVLTGLKNGRVIVRAVVDSSPLVFGEMPVTITGQLVNLAQGKTATASSFANYGTQGQYPPGNAIDGRLDTMWLVNGTIFPSWLNIDLGRPEPLTSIVQRFSGEQAASWRYRFEGSNDNSTWVKLVDRTASGVNSGVIRETVSGTWRYVRFTVTGADGWPNSTELGIFGTQAPNRFPTGIILSAATVTEETPAGTLVGILSATDPDANERFTFALVEGPGSVDNALFRISGDRLVTDAVLGFDGPRQRSVRVRVTDRGGLDFERAFVVAVESAGEIVIEVPAGEVWQEDRTLAGDRGLVKRGPGTLVLTVAGEYSGGTVVEEGTLVVRHPSALSTGTLDVRAGAKLTLDIGTRRLSLPAMTIAGTGTLDLGAGSVVLAAGSFDLAALRGLIVSGRNNGAWTGNGITSSSARGLPFHEVGYRVLQDGSALVGFSAIGDATVDGSVNIQDLIAISASGKYGSGTTDAAWWEGDFNYDGVVNITDLINLSASGLYGAGSYLPVAIASQMSPQQSEASPSDALSGLTATPTGETPPANAESAVGPWQVDSAGHVAQGFASSDRISGNRSVGRLAWAAIANQCSLEAPKDGKSVRWRILAR